MNRDPDTARDDRTQCWKACENSSAPVHREGAITSGSHTSPCTHLSLLRGSNTHKVSAAVV
eukprot:4909305-Heterocapsa_arctica.AAC.1